MDLHDLTRDLNQKNDSKIVMLVADGLGGLSMTPTGLTELETAKTPNFAKGNQDVAPGCFRNDGKYVVCHHASHPSDIYAERHQLFRLPSTGHCPGSAPVLERFHGCPGMSGRGRSG
jgi:hypothetical protein